MVALSKLNFKISCGLAIYITTRCLYRVIIIAGGHALGRPSISNNFSPAAYSRYGSVYIRNTLTALTRRKKVYRYNQSSFPLWPISPKYFYSQFIFCYLLLRLASNPNAKVLHSVRF